MAGIQQHALVCSFQSGMSHEYGSLSAPRTENRSKDCVNLCNTNCRGWLGSAAAILQLPTGAPARSQEFTAATPDIKQFSSEEREAGIRIARR
jgi:hypothetical protein